MTKHIRIGIIFNGIKYLYDFEFLMLEKIDACAYCLCLGKNILEVLLNKLCGLFYFDNLLKI